MSPRPEFWFPVKRYGWGWGLPVRWQGWIVMVGYLALMFAAAAYFKPQYNPIVFWAAVTVLTGLLIVIVAVKGERPVGWRWGRK